MNLMFEQLKVFSDYLLIPKAQIEAESLPGIERNVVAKKHCEKSPSVTSIEQSPQASIIRLP